MIVFRDISESQCNINLRIKVWIGGKLILNRIYYKVFEKRLFYNYIFLIFNVGGCKYVIYFVGFSKIEL